MRKAFKENFNFITNILILTILLFGGFVWADTNGIWHYAKDIRSGIFGFDKDGIDGGFSFISDVTFNADVNLNNVSSCTGKLITEPDGTIYCDVDNVNDADYVIGNEIQILSLTGNTITLSNGGGSVVLPSNNVPSGAVMAFNLVNCPSGWILANGSSGTP